MRAVEEKRVGRPPAKFKLTVTEDSGKTRTISTDSMDAVGMHLAWEYGQGHDVELELREAGIILRGV